jgi:hypothetical protein
MSRSVGVDIETWGALRAHSLETVIADAGASNAVCRAGLTFAAEVIVDKA